MILGTGVFETLIKRLVIPAQVGKWYYWTEQTVYVEVELGGLSYKFLGFHRAQKRLRQSPVKLYAQV